MKIIEEIRYTLQDIIDQIKVDFGFGYKEISETSGRINLGGQYNLEVEFSQEPKLVKAVMLFPGNAFDVTESTAALEMINSCSESAIQVIDLITRMTSSGGDDSEEDL